MKKSRTLLVVRFSAFGDVAISVPLIAEFAQQNRDTKFIILTRKKFSILFEGLGDNIFLFPVDLTTNYKGFKGLWKLFREIRKTHTIDGVADIHDVLRTKILRSFFWIFGSQVAVINKGRKEKSKLTTPSKKDLKPLKNSIERYATVLKKLNTSGTLGKTRKNYLPHLKNGVFFKKKQKEIRIGIAPFAYHKTKQYPIEKIGSLLLLLSKYSKNISFFLFGGGEKEKQTLEVLATNFPTSVNMAGKFSLTEELSIMSSLDVLISMDSANMHLASVVGVRVISIWGGTHPYAGFLGHGQTLEDCIQKDFSCRPCSVFGKKTCYKEDFRCLLEISPEEIAEKVISVIS